MSSDRDDLADALATLRAQSDQAKACASELAGLVGTYFRLLRVYGMKRDEALELVLAYQSVLLGGQP